VKKLTLLLLPLALAACAPESVDRYQTGESSAELTSLLNEREYGKVIWLIESREGREPVGEDAYLLAQAYLGRAGLEPLAFAASVTAPEIESELSAKIFPKCAKDRIDSVKQLPMKCVLKRVYLRAALLDGNDLARARLLFRRAYPDPATSPQWVNTLIGVVEMVSLVRRVGDVYLYARRFEKGGDRPILPDIPWVQTQGREALIEAREALGRANHAGEKTARLLSGAKANEWFERVEGTIQFAREIGLARFLDFVRENLLKAEDEIRYGEKLDKLREILEQIDA
jgi:hypothetical protein